MIRSISIYELYDLYSIFCLLRSQITFNNYSMDNFTTILKIILEEFEKETDWVQPNTIRKKLRDAKVKMLEDLWDPVYVDNIYTYFGAFVKEGKELYYLMLAVKKLLFLCDECSRQQAYNFLDDIHFIPILISEQKKLPKYIIQKIIN